MIFYFIPLQEASGGTLLDSVKPYSNNAMLDLDLDQLVNQSYSRNLLDCLVAVAVVEQASQDAGIAVAQDVPVA